MKIIAWLTPPLLLLVGMVLYDKLRPPQLSHTHCTHDDGTCCLCETLGHREPQKASLKGMRGRRK